MGGALLWLTEGLVLCVVRISYVNHFKSIVTLVLQGMLQGPYTAVI